MRKLLWWIVWVCLLLVAITVSARAWVSRQHHSRERVFQFSYHASITDLPAQGSEVRIWVPLAKTRDNQRILSRQIKTRYPYEIHEEPVFGNDILYVALHASIPPRVDITVDYDASVRSGYRLGSRRLFAASQGVASADELAPALRDEPFMVVNDVVKRLTTEATSGQTTDLSRARAIYEYVIAHMSYDKTVPGWGRGDTLRACLLGKGNCTDFHSLFISMARSVDIPARFVIGATIPQEPEGEIPGYHCWAEAYLPEYGWVPVDAAEAWRQPTLREYYFGALDPNKLLISAGRNIQLVPAQRGLPVNIFIDPYVEVDGRSFGAVETRFEFRDRKHKEART